MVLVEDECRIEVDMSTKPVWLERGQQPELKQIQTKEAVSFYGALNVSSGKCHIRKFTRQTSANTVIFLKQLEEYYKGKRVLLVWDGAPWHRGKVAEYLKTHKKFKWLEIINFRLYSPDVNPQEHVWKEAKKNSVHNSEKGLKEKVDDFQYYIRTHNFNTNFLSKYVGI